jgi:hypothetical protein
MSKETLKEKLIDLILDTGFDNDEKVERILQLFIDSLPKVVHKAIVDLTDWNRPSYFSEYHYKNKICPDFVEQHILSEIKSMLGGGE